MQAIFLANWYIRQKFHPIVLSGSDSFHFIFVLGSGNKEKGEQLRR
jgi:hypothetical protein